MRRLLVLGALLSACGGLSNDDATLVRHAAILNGMAYAHEDPATPNAALERGAYCTTAAVLRRNKLAVPDAGINCEMSP